MGFVAAVDACAAESDSLLRWAAFSALAYGARGIVWQNAGACAALGSPKLGLLSSINNRIAGSSARPGALLLPRMVIFACQRGRSGRQPLRLMGA